MTAFNKFSFAMILAMIFFVSTPELLAQDSEQDVLQSGNLSEQYDYVQRRTRIYEGFRAVREDMFQKLKTNSLDSLRQARMETQSYITRLNQANARMDSLSLELSEALNERDQAIGEKDSISLLGIPVNKTFYNVMLWSIIGGLVILAAIIFFLFKRSHRITRQVSREMNDLQEEYDEYRKTSRERFEKQSIDHFNELRKLKGI